MPRFAVVIPARDRAGLLALCLCAVRRAAARLAGDDGEIDVVVVDGGSRDETVAVARQAGARVLTLPDAPPGAMRNHGAAATNAEWIVFLDCDVEIDAEFFSTAVVALADPAVAAAGSPCRPPAGATWVARGYDWLRARPATRRTTRWLPTPGLVVRRSAFAAAGGFDARLRDCEDVDFSRRLRAATHPRTLLFEPGLTATHHCDPETLRDVFAAELFRGRDNLRVSLAGLPDPRDMASLVLSLSTAASATALAAALVWAASGDSWPAAMAAALLVAAVLARVGRGGWPGWLRLPPTAAVAATYEAARALAVLRPGRARSPSR